MLNIPRHRKLSRLVFEYPEFLHLQYNKSRYPLNNHTKSPTTTYKFSKHAMRNLSPKDQLLFERFGQGRLASLPYNCIHQAFEAQAKAQPQAIAAYHLGESITYRELDRQANRLAVKLAQLGVSTGDNVALFLQRSIPMLVGILAALKVGASYVPQHVGVAPEAHLRHIIEIASTRVILTLSSLRSRVPVPDGHICLAIDDLMQEPFADDSAFTIPFTPDVPVSSQDTCYILFTSGTTGTPNGVMVTHRNVCNILLTEPGSLGMRPGLKVSQLLSIAFDMAAWEILGCLGNGATLVIRGKDFQKAVQQVDVVISTPSILSTLDSTQCRNVQTVAVAGEPCPRPLADQWAQFAAFYNACGPTETTIVNTAQHYFPHSERLTIGTPTPNNTVYILDKNLKPLPIGEVGEMWAGGDCVSAGYLSNEELNQERYYPDPFLGDGHRMFRTRDLGRWTGGGELEHFGRSDDQVKIRGFRVELDSVSAVLESVPPCTHAVTLKYDDRSLVAFVTPKTINVAEALNAVSEALPYYCIPALILAFDELPITSRGKVDKRALLQWAVAELETSQQPAELLEVKS